MDNNEIRNANKKALPKFMVIMICCLVIGIVIGFCSVKFGSDSMAGGIRGAGEFFAANIAPWLLLAVAIILPVVCVPIYRNAKKLIVSWDGEDEETPDLIDKQHSIIIWITNIATILSYFLIVASYSKGFEVIESKGSILMFYASIAAFFAIMIETVIFQQKCVDATKKLNPEKTASVYDTRFQKKWMDSCDEAEKIMIGKCAYRSYTVTNTACVILSTVLAVCALVFRIGFLPSLVVCLIWIVNQSTYCIEAFKYSKAGNKIS
ncbi:MAG: DUF3169 family protein [Ruminococcus sp.]|nr:DUF3169 family protein [Ruminococcus sp.]